MPAKPDRQAALEQYRRRAGVYDLELALFEPIRREAIVLLAPRPGETVIDFGCGTGLSLPQVRAAVGAGGQVVGIEQSPEMIERARQRVVSRRWRNVELICSPVETAHWQGKADAALFHFTHDLLQRPEAVAHALGMLRKGARVVASGLRWAPPWATTRAAVARSGLRPYHIRLSQPADGRPSTSRARSPRAFTRRRPGPGIASGPGSGSCRNGRGPGGWWGPMRA